MTVQGRPPFPSLWLFVDSYLSSWDWAGVRTGAIFSATVCSSTSILPGSSSVSILVLDHLTQHFEELCFEQPYLTAHFLLKSSFVPRFYFWVHKYNSTKCVLSDCGSKLEVKFSFLTVKVAVVIHSQALQYIPDVMYVYSISQRPSKARLMTNELMTKIRPKTKLKAKLFLEKLYHYCPVLNA